MLYGPYYHLSQRQRVVQLILPRRYSLGSASAPTHALLFYRLTAIHIRDSLMAPADAATATDLYTIEHPSAFLYSLALYAV